MKFNPPPDWPQPPTDWTPPPGWTPDPSWPPPPPGWQLWVEDNPANEPSGGNRGKIVLAASLAVALVVAVVGAVVIFRDSEDSDSSAAATTTTSVAKPTRTSVVERTPTTTPSVLQPNAYAPLPQPTPKPSSVDCTYSSAQRTAKPVKPPQEDGIPTTGVNATAELTMQTNQGDLVLTLDNSVSPCTTNNFVSLAEQGYFDQTVCHRLTMADSLKVLQCGDPSGTGMGGPGYEFENEYPTDAYTSADSELQEPVGYKRGLIAMANAGPGTNGSQFFLVYGDSTLPPQYTVFGTIDEEGLRVLDAIAANGIDASGATEDGPPATPVKITSVQLN